MRKGFTLVELLVSIGIIALLVSILLPVLTGVRKSANRAACRANLHDVGLQFQMYLNDSKNRLPRVNTMPSLQPPLNDAPSIAQLLKPYHRGVAKVFRCPSDQITLLSDSAPAGFETYYDREGSSYQYDPRLSAQHAGEQIKDIPLYSGGRQSYIPVMYDYEPFHGAKGTSGSCNYLFADLHVGDLTP